MNRTMKTLLSGAALFALVPYATPANAGPLLSISDALGNCGTCQGLTYTLEEEIPNPLQPLTAEFTLKITGENTASDTIGGRTGINSVAFNLVTQNPIDSPITGTMVGTIFNGVLTAPDPRYVFTDGGLNSSGCDGSGNFYCFDNTLIPPIPASPLLTGPIFLSFEATLAPGGSWDNYATALKIDWVGSASSINPHGKLVSGYDLVSKPIPVNFNDCPDCVINPTDGTVPEPSSLMLMASFGVTAIGAGLWRRRNHV